MVRMSANPDDFLIFKLRAQKGGAEVAGKPVQKAPEAAQAPARNGLFHWPTAVQPAQAAPEPDKGVSAQQAEGEAAAANAKRSFLETGGYESPEHYYRLGMEDRQIKEAEKEGKYFNIKNKAHNRELAKGLHCSVHPWRHAYAICSSCHRPFCFEDISEYNNRYYCFNDIGSVESNRMNRLVSEYSATSLLVTLVSVLMFLLFMYYARAQVGYLFGYAASIGIVAFVRGITLQYMLALANLAIVAVGVVSGLYIISGSRSSSIVAAAFGILGVALFSYEYTIYLTGYLGMLALLEFVSFALVVYTTTTKVVVKEEGSESERALASGMQYWAHAGDF
jgi:hypothetical protein